MKSTGIIRKVDELGRITIPKEIRSQFEIYEQDPLEVFVEGEKIILKKCYTYVRSVSNLAEIGGVE